MSELYQTALKIVSNGKGILAADESNPSMIKKFDSINVKSNPENRLNYREILFSADGMKNCIGGVILFDETIKQITSSGTSIPDLIQNSGTIIGIKVDMGLKEHPDSSEEKVTEGLEGLKERLEEYYKMGARFTKWRALLNISEKYPSEIAIQSNANTLAKYAALVQESNMVPIVEPEVLMDGDHDINKCYQVTAKVLTACYAELKLHNVDLKGTLLKPNMVLPGTLSQNRNSTEEIAKMTLKCLKENVPSEVPGIAFLSGGQSEIEATRNLNEINKINDTNFVFTFSYGRALQQSALKYWGKNQGDITNTQNIFNHRAKMNSLSTSGRWTEDLDKIIIQ
jgi:fructose-bisphosphate aldolase class I